MRVAGDLCRDHILPLAGRAYDTERRVLWNAAIGEAAAIVGVGHRARGPFAVVERVARAASRVEQGFRLRLCSRGPDENDAAVVAEIKRNHFTAAGDGGPAAFVADARLRRAIGVRVGFRDGP